MSSPLRAQFRALRHLTAPLRDRFRMLRGTHVVQQTAALRPEHRTARRRRQHVLVDLINRYCSGPGVVIVEVGTVGGGTSAHIARYCPQIRKLYAVDIVKPDAAIDVMHTVPHLEFVHSDSVLAAKRFDDKSIDLVFIDADHSAKGVFADLQAWVPKIKPGGVISGHDYGSHNHPGVKPAVDFYFALNPANPLQVDADKVWWTLKY